MCYNSLTNEREQNSLNKKSLAIAKKMKAQRRRQTAQHGKTKYMTKYNSLGYQNKPSKTSIDIFIKES